MNIKMHLPTEEPPPDFTCKRWEGRPGVPGEDFLGFTVYTTFVLNRASQIISDCGPMKPASVFKIGPGGDCLLLPSLLVWFRSKVSPQSLVFRGGIWGGDWIVGSWVDSSTNEVTARGLRPVRRRGAGTGPAGLYSCLVASEPPQAGRPSSASPPSR